jgi:glycosyltransferase involved in cell wall biosynthesis
MRYIWDAEDDYSFDPVRQFVLGACRKRLRDWDLESANRVDRFIANSRFVSGRIQKYYGRDAEVINPPIDTDFFVPASEVKRDDFYLAAGALVSYKKTDHIVQAFNALGLPLVVAGKGPELGRLRRMAGSNIDFRGWVADQELRHLYRSAKGLVLAAREDFGMMAIEAQACGCPVIGFSGGAYSETVQDGVNGVLFKDRHVADIVHAIRRFESMSWPVARVRHQVEGYSREVFKARIREFIGQRTANRVERTPVSQPA